MEQILNAVKLLASLCDGAKAQDGQGFNGFDAEYVHNYLLIKPKWSNKDSHDAYKMLKKYRHQLQDRFGIDYEAITPPEDKSLVITPVVSERWGSLNMYLTGQLTKDKFDTYRDIHKNLGFTCAKDKDGKWNWFLKRVQIASYDHNSYKRQMMELGITVLDVVEPNNAQKSIKDTIQAIRNQQIKNCVAVTYEEGLFSFHFPFHDSLVEIFSNNSGMLTGITEFNIAKNTRETREIETALEAIDKIKSLLPSWTIVTQGVDEAISQRNKEIALNRIPIPEVTSVINPDYFLFFFQNESVRWLYKTDGNALLGLEMGLGKTIISLSYVTTRRKRCIVVCPKVVRRTWIKEAERLFPSYFLGKTVELKPCMIKKERDAEGKLKPVLPDLKDVNIASVNYESFEKFLPAILAAGFDTIILDESQRVKEPRAKITKTILSLQDVFKHRILLSGTAVKNKKIELLTQANFIQPNLFTAAELKRGTIGGCWSKLRKTIYFTKRKIDVLPDLPKQINQIVELDVASMPDMPDDIGEISQVRNEAAIAKADATIDFVREILDSSDSCVLVFTESVVAAQKIASHLGDKAILHYGQMTDKQREAAKDEFQEGKTGRRVFVTTRPSLAVGATLTRADRVVFNDLPWSHADIAQGEARVHRIGQKNCVNVYWIVASGSDWDRNLTDIIKRKYILTKKINEGKQITKEERDWLDKPISLSEINFKLQL